MQLNDLNLAQISLMDYFRYVQENVSWGRLDVRCRVLAQQFMGKREEDKSAKYAIWQGLLRQGLIEFCGKGQYCLAPSVAIANIDRWSGVNWPVPMVTELRKSGFEVFATPVGLFTIKIHREEPFSIFETFKVPVRNSTGFALLSNLPPISKAIEEKFIPYNCLDEEVHTFVPDTGWQEKKTKLTAPSIFRLKSQGGTKRYLYTYDQRSFEVPELSEYPDGFNLAYFAAISPNRFREEVQYKQSTKILRVKSIFFPILMERLIRIGYATNINAIRTSHRSTEYFDFPVSAWQNLIRIFHQPSAL